MRVTNGVNMLHNAHMPAPKRQTTRLLLPLCLSLFGVFFLFAYFPGFQDFDLVDICKQALRRNYLNWYPAYISFLFRITLPLFPPLQFSYVAALLLLLSGVALLVRMALPGRYVLQTAFALFLCSYPAGLLVFLYPSRDSWVAVSGLWCGLAAFVALRSSGLLRTIAFACSFAMLISMMMARPDTLLATLPFIYLYAWSYADARGFAQRQFRRRLFCAGFSLLLLGLFVSAHFALKHRVRVNKYPLSGTVYHILLHDVFLVSRLEGLTMQLPGFPKECDISAEELLTIEYGGWERLERRLRIARPDYCYSYALYKRAEMKRAWLRLIPSHPLTYLHARLLYAKSLLGYARQQRGFPFGQPLPSRRRIVLNETLLPHFSPEVLGRCISKNYLRTLSHWQRSLPTLIVDSGKYFFMQGWFYLVCSLLSLALLSRTRSTDHHLRTIAIVLLCSGLLHLLTLFFIGPTNAYRYIRWFTFSSLLGTVLAGICVIRSRDTPHDS